MTVVTTDRILTTCPRDCYDSCGIVVVRRQGRIAQVRGNPDHAVSRGTLCGKCSVSYNREWLDPQHRLTEPLRRAGPKGSGMFEPVSWDEALADIASRLSGIVRDAGAQTVLNAHYTGTISLLAGVFPMRFFRRLGATEVAPDTICNMAGHVALNYAFGTSVDGFDPRTAAHANCILVWGANPSSSAPHVQEHWLAGSKASVVVVDPIRTASAAAADIHLQLRPGTDAVLAFAMLHVINRDALLDTTFISEHVLGWDEMLNDVRSVDLAWAAEVTGVAVPLIEQVARLYAAGPSLLWLGQGLQRQPYGGNVIRTCATLPAVTGNLGKPGCGILYLNGNGAARGVDDGYVLRGPSPDPAPPISHMDFAAHLEDPALSRALIVWNMNPAASNPEQTRLRTALSREDLLVVTADLFMTDTALLSDYVLPAASFLEFDDIVLSYFHLTVSAQVKAAEPLGEALPNSEIFRRLSRAMGYTEPELYEPDAQILERVLAGGTLGETFDSLRVKGTVWSPAEPAVQFADQAYATPSGRIELASAAAEAAGLPRTPQLIADAPPTDGRLRLLSPAHAWTSNTSFGNVGRVLARLGQAEVYLHPADAAERALTEGAPALVYNDTGALQLAVRVSDSLPRGVALVHKGRWLIAEPNGANVNVLNDGQKSDMGESTAVHGVQVHVVAVGVAAV